jgi:hypothetical protein
VAERPMCTVADAGSIPAASIKVIVYLLKYLIFMFSLSMAGAAHIGLFLLRVCDFPIFFNNLPARKMKNIIRGIMSNFLPSGALTAIFLP